MNSFWVVLCWQWHRFQVLGSLRVARFEIIFYIGSSDVNKPTGTVGFPKRFLFLLRSKS
jgi:hypothetical protein